MKRTANDLDRTQTVLRRPDAAQLSFLPLKLATHLLAHSTVPVTPLNIRSYSPASLAPLARLRISPRSLFAPRRASPLSPPPLQYLDPPAGDSASSQNDNDPFTTTLTTFNHVFVQPKLLCILTLLLWHAVHERRERCVSIL